MPSTNEHFRTQCTLFHHPTNPRQCRPPRYTVCYRMANSSFSLSEDEGTHKIIFGVSPMAALSGASPLLLRHLIFRNHGRHDDPPRKQEPLPPPAGRYQSDNACIEPKYHPNRSFVAPLPSSFSTPRPQTPKLEPYVCTKRSTTPGQLICGSLLSVFLDTLTPKPQIRTRMYTKPFNHSRKTPVYITPTTILHPPTDHLGRSPS